MNKDTARAEFGKEQVFKWRRGYKNNPPRGESLQDVYRRAVPYFKAKVMPHVKAGKNVMISAHGNSLRALIKYIDKISDDEIPHLELVLGKPIIYMFDNNKLVLVNHTHNFDRPIHWQGVKKHARDYSHAKTTTAKIKK